MEYSPDYSYCQPSEDKVKQDLMGVSKRITHFEVVIETRKN